MSLVEEKCEALIITGPGMMGIECPHTCGKPATVFAYGYWFCVQHEAEVEAGGVWVFGDCPHCGGQHGRETRTEAPLPPENPFRILP
jgi:hypothetical protein